MDKQAAKEEAMKALERRHYQQTGKDDTLGRANRQTGCNFGFDAGVEWQLEQDESSRAEPEAKCRP